MPFMREAFSVRPKGKYRQLRRRPGDVSSVQQEAHRQPVLRIDGRKRGALLSFVHCGKVRTNTAAREQPSAHALAGRDVLRECWSIDLSLGAAVGLSRCCYNFFFFLFTD